MTELEKIEALEKAYAEMILQAAKEAAARVLAAELKARRFEHDLVFTRDEASRLLHRSKQVIDAKTKEAEVKLLNQQTRFDELESQLNETEGVILDLRAELNEARERLSEEKNKARFRLQQNENEKAMPEAEFNGYEMFASSLDSGLRPVTVNSNSSCPEGSTLNLKYECAERNYAAEASLVNKRSPPREKSGPCNDSTNTENVKSVESAFVFEEKVQHGKHEAFSVARRSTRERKVERWGDAIATFGVCSSRQFKNPSRAFRHFSRWKSNKVKRCFKSGQRKCQSIYKTQIEESLGYVQEFPSGEFKLAEYVPKHMDLIDVLIEQDFEYPQNDMESIDVLLEQDVFVEQDAEHLLKDMELVNVLVEKDELAEMFNLNSSSSIVCDVEGTTVIEAPNVSIADTKENFYYKYSRKRKRTIN